MNGDFKYKKDSNKIIYLRSMINQHYLIAYYDGQIKGTKTTKPFFEEKDYSLAYSTIFLCIVLLNDEIIKLKQPKKKRL